MMQKFDVIITCSGLGTRLKPITDYLNKSLVKLGDKPILSHIIDTYPTDCRFIITVGHFKEQVEDYLKIAHPDKNITIVEVDKFDGKGASLLYSLSQAFDIIDKPFIFNACDTYAQGLDFESLEGNVAFSARASIENQYRFFGDFIEERPSQMGEDCYIGLCYIEDIAGFKGYARELLKTQSETLSDANVLQCMNVKKIVIESSQWSDIGNYAALEKAKSEFKNTICVLEKENAETYCVSNKIIKFFSDKDKVNKLYLRSFELADCAPVVNKTRNFLSYDFIPGETFSKIINKKELIDFLDWCKQKLWISQENQASELDFFLNFYVNKADSRVEQYLKRFPDSEKTQEVNFRKVENIYALLSKASNLENETIFCRTHGDLVFENVIKTDSYSLIDWREEFYGETGDLYYDLAKMKHNLIFNHDVIKKEKFFVKEDNEKVIFDPGIPQGNYDLLSIFDSWCLQNQYDLTTIDLKVALIQLSSSGLHLHNDAKLLYYMGLYNLQKIINGKTT